MASTINADNGVSSGTSGLKSTADASGVLTLQTNGTTALTLDTSQKLTLPSTTLGTAAAGLTEYNGTSMFFTPAGTQRGIIPSQQMYVLASNLAGLTSTTASSFFQVGCTLSSSTQYRFEIMAAVQASNSATAHTFNFGFGGTATVNSILYKTSGIDQGGTIPLVDTSTNDAIVNTVSQTAISTSYGNNPIVQAWIMVGVVSINAGGTFIPQYNLSASGPSYTLFAGSYITIYPIGAAGANVNVGTWA